jgi:DNA-binding transcriptional ArsR family regulator
MPFYFVYVTKLNRSERLKSIQERVENRRRRIIDYVKERGPATPEQIAEALGIHRSTLSVDMAALREAGKLRYHLDIPGIIEVKEVIEG